MALLKFSGETKHLIYAIIVLSVVFAFNDGRESFVFSLWAANFIRTLILVSVVVMTFVLGVRLGSKLFNYRSEFSIWKLKKYFLSKDSNFPLELTLLDKKILRINTLHMGVIISLFLAIVSNGTVFFTAIFTFFIKEKKKIGKERVYLKGFTEASIALISVFSIVVLIILFKLMGIQEGIKIASWFLLWNLIPIGPLLGSKILFNSRTIYVGLLIFMILFLSIITIIPWLVSIIISGFFAVIALIIYFVKFEYK